MKERPMLPTQESFTTRQDLQGNHANAAPLRILFKERLHHSLVLSERSAPHLKQQRLKAQRTALDDMRWLLQFNL